MQFVDEATIEVAAGHGGPGRISFRREAHVNFGGPNGGDGGRGGDIVVEATQGAVTLLDHRYRRWYKGEAGDKGGRKNMSGRSGETLIIPVPAGTVITDVATGEILADLVLVGDRVVVAQGGRGGQGNTHFVTSTRQAPKHAQDGEPGGELTLKLTLKLVADIGLVGLPNAGKSTFIRAVTNSNARVGAYPFTTLVPNLGVYRRGELELVIADIPGLIEGAADGLGLGDQFLKHLERTRVLIHLLSLSQDSMGPVEAYDVVNTELRRRSEDLANRPQLVVLNKIDLLEDRYEIDLWTEEFNKRGVQVFAVSGMTGEKVESVLSLAAKLLADSVPAKAKTPWSPI